MCGRFTMTRRDRAEVAALLGIPESELGDYVPRFNIAPTQPYFILKTKYDTGKAAVWFAQETGATAVPALGFVRTNQPCTPLSRCAAYWGVSASGYYAQLKRPSSARARVMPNSARRSQPYISAHAPPSADLQPAPGALSQSVDRRRSRR